MIKVVIEMPQENVKVYNTEAPPPHLDEGVDTVTLLHEFDTMYHLHTHYEWKLNERDDIRYYIDNVEIFPRVWSKDHHIVSGLTKAVMTARS